MRPLPCQLRKVSPYVGMYRCCPMIVDYYHSTVILFSTLSTPATTALVCSSIYAYSIVRPFPSRSCVPSSLLARLVLLFDLLAQL